MALKLIEELERVFLSRPKTAEIQETSEYQPIQLQCTNVHGVQLEIVDELETVKTIKYPNIAFDQFLVRCRESFSNLINGSKTSLSLSGRIKGTSTEEKEALLQFKEHTQSTEFGNKIWISSEIRNEEPLSALPWMRNLPKDKLAPPDIEIDLEIVKL